MPDPNYPRSVLKIGTAIHLPDDTFPFTPPMEHIKAKAAKIPSQIFMANYCTALSNDFSSNY